LAVELAKEKGNDQPMKCLLIALIWTFLVIQEFKSYKNILYLRGNSFSTF
jgi:hypothetical protein